MNENPLFQAGMNKWKQQKFMDGLLKYIQYREDLRAAILNENSSIAENLKQTNVSIKRVTEKINDLEEKKINTEKWKNILQTHKNTKERLELSVSALIGERKKKDCVETSDNKCFIMG